MPELRRNPLNGGWVVVAPERASRPDTFRALSGASSGGDQAGPDDCPFCPGNESMTPPEVARTGDGDANEPGWRVRVVPNLYPIVSGDPVHAAATPSRFHDALRGGGAHEVVILSPDHDRTLADLTGVEVEDLFDVVAQRMRAHAAAGHVYSQVLVNHGHHTGAGDSATNRGAVRSASSDTARQTGHSRALAMWSASTATAGGAMPTDTSCRWGCSMEAPAGRP